jgi:hypothetical protein
MELKDAFDMVKVWLSEMEDDELANEEFYSHTLGYTFEDVAKLVDASDEFYRKNILGE